MLAARYQLVRIAHLVGIAPKNGVFSVVQFSWGVGLLQTEARKLGPRPDGGAH